VPRVMPLYEAARKGAWAGRWVAGQKLSKPGLQKISGSSHSSGPGRCL